MPLANPPRRGARTVEVVKTEEKGSDVNLATYLLLDAFQHDCNVAVVISNDSDLKLPIEIAQSELGIRVGVVNPHPPARRSRALQPTFFKQLRTRRRSARVSSRPCSWTQRVRFASRHAGSGRSAPETQRPAEAGLAPSHRSGWGDVRILATQRTDCDFAA